MRKEKPARTGRLILYLLMLVAGLSAGGCGFIPGSGSTGQEGATPVPTATLDPAGYRGIPSQACPIADWTVMQSNKPQGDLIAWQPGSQNIAYMAPSRRSSWFIGELMLAKGPDFQEQNQLAPGVLASGDLTWSPSGGRLAFLAFRPNENVYTVMVVGPDGRGLVDLFPTDLAHSDTRTSQKAILGWKDENTLQVMTSCGEECRQAYDVGVNAKTSPDLVPTEVGNYQLLGENLLVRRLVPTFKPEDYPKIISTPVWSPEDGWITPSWSPDKAWVAYLDRRAFLWVLSPKTKTTFQVEIGLRDLNEVQWSSDSTRLAVRAEDHAFTFQIPCTSK